MSYRSIKKVLGENSLERKCRILFGFCMLILIGSSFYAVSRITENLVRDKTREIANESIEVGFLRNHIEKLANEEMFRKISESLGDSNYNYTLKTVTLDEVALRYKVDSHIERDPEIIEHLKPIAEQLRSVQDRLHQEARNNSSKQDDPNNPIDQNADVVKALEGEMGDFGVNYYDAYVKAQPNSPNSSDPIDNTATDMYVFYKPVLFTSNCADCHGIGNRGESDGGEPGQIILGSPEVRDAARPTIFFLRYSLPIAEANAAINSNLAILLATAIITAFLSTAALYVIMRYVIVKPLQHLRSVSEEVSQGNMEVRAELYTGDEFEQLSRSFNRMLRYMSDAQTALQTANRDLDNKVDEQAQLTMKLYELNKIKSEFLASMSHELRTPLNSIIGFSEVLTDIDSLTSKQKGYANNILKSGKSLLDLINDILDLAKLEAGKTDVNPIEFQVISTAEEVKSMIGKMADDKRINLQFKVENQLEPVYQDPIKIRQIVTNLLANAVKFTPEGGRIRMTIAEVDHDNFSIEVDDTGVGIAETERKLIFEKFRQGSSATGSDQLTRRHEGTGLGLSIVKELCVLMGGSVSVDSVVGKGSTFLVKLPKTYSPQPAAFPTGKTQTELKELAEPRIPIVESTIETD